MIRLTFVMLIIVPLGVYAEMAQDHFRQIEHTMNRQQRQKEQQQNVASWFENNQVFETSELMGALLQAVNREDVKQTEYLLQQYRALPNYDPDMVLFVQANQAVWQDNIDQAISLYQTIYRRNPQFLRGKLDLARLLFVDKQNKEAEMLFDDIRLPEKPVVQQKVEQFRTALQNRRQWHGNLSIGGGYDSNLNRSNGATVWRSQYSCFDLDGSLFLDKQGKTACQDIRIPATAEQSISSQMFTYDAGLSRKQPLSGHHYLGINVNAYGNIYPEHREYTEHNISFQPAYHYQSYRHQASFEPVYQLSMIGGHAFNSSSGVQIRYGYEFSPRTYSDIQIQYKYDHYRAKNLRHFNGSQISMFTNTVHRFPSGWMVFGGYDFLQKNSLEEVDSYRRHGVRLGVYQSFDIGIEASFQAAYRHTRYFDYNAWFETTRQDNEQVYSLDLTLNKLAIKNTVPVISLKRTRNQSNVWLNKYRRNEVAIKLNYVF